MKAGDAVEVLRTWAYGADPDWIDGYALVEETRQGLKLRKVGGFLDGALSLWPRDKVRLKEKST